MAAKLPILSCFLSWRMGNVLCAPWETHRKLAGTLLMSINPKIKFWVAKLGYIWLSQSYD